jgi:hypothetical protein
VADFDAAHVLLAGLAGADGQRVRHRDLATGVGRDGELAGAVGGIGGELIETLSAETPRMVAPAASNWSFCWAKVWASRSQPPV